MLVIYHNLSNRPQKTYRPTHSRKSPEKRDFVVHTHIVKPKKISWLRPPEISRFRGVFSRFLTFSQPRGLRIQSAEKKISFQKNGSLQDVEQLSPAAKA